MGVENLKRWHWMVIGLLVGLALAFLNQLSRPGDDSWTGRTLGQMRFEGLVTATPINGNPVIANVRIFPSEVSEATGRKVAVVAFDQLVQVGDTEVWKYEASRFLAPEPINPLQGKRVGEGMTAREYVEYFAKQNDTWKFRYAWWAEPRNAYLIWGAAGFILIGGVWPTLLNLLIGAGLGRAPEPKVKKVRLSKVKSQTASEPVPVTAGLAAVEELNASLEKDLVAAGLFSEGSDDPDDSTAGKPVVQKLTGGPLDAPPEPGKPALTKPSDAYQGGVFYPVAQAPTKPE